MVKCGIDRIGEYAHLFLGKRLGMVTSVSGVTSDGRPSYLAFHQQFPLSCIFSPEHGLHATFGNGEDVTEEPTEPQTGAALVSLFGNWTAKSIPEHWLSQLDAVVYDIQDLGTRFYTFITTMIRVLEDCAAADRELIILDRPAVLGGNILEGCLLEARYQSFIGPYCLPIRYGMTVGELARMVNGERKLNCRLHVVPCEGWQRDQMFPDYGHRWVSPSGAISDFETALLYPGMCLFEGTNLSEGRGTGRAFRLVGAPFIDGQRLCREMTALKLPGVAFEAAAFCPASSKFKGETCGGVSIRITDTDAFRTVRTGVSLLYKILELYPGMVEFPPSHWSPEPHIRFLAGSDSLDNTPPPLHQLLECWERDCEAFRERKIKYHIYP
jgi:uncharacterized protein YbbC (DUF1343 family)